MKLNRQKVVKTVYVVVFAAEMIVETLWLMQRL
jgi:hypothetical protein